MTWTEVRGTATNTFNVTRQNSGYNANYDDHVIVGDAETVVLPEPALGEAVMISTIGRSFTVESHDETAIIEDEHISKTLRPDDAPIFVSDGSAWYIASNLSDLSIPTKALEHEWQVTESGGELLDTEGSNNLNVVFGSFDTTTATFKEGISFSTNGVDEYAEGRIASKFSNEFTISWWIYPQSTEGIYYSNGRSGEEAPLLRANASDEWEAAVNVDGTLETVTGSTITLNELTLITVTYSSGTLSLYENETFQSETSVGSVTQPSRPLSVGARIDENGNDELWAEALYDWGLFYSRELSQDAIDQIYNAHPSTE